MEKVPERVLDVLGTELDAEPDDDVAEWVWSPEVERCDGVLVRFSTQEIQEGKKRGMFLASREKYGRAFIDGVNKTTKRKHWFH